MKKALMLCVFIVNTLCGASSPNYFDKWKGMKLPEKIKAFERFAHKNYIDLNLKGRTFKNKTYPEIYKDNWDSRDWFPHDSFVQLVTHRQGDLVDYLLNKGLGRYFLRKATFDDRVFKKGKRVYSGKIADVEAVKFLLGRKIDINAIDAGESIPFIQEFLKQMKAEKKLGLAVTADILSLLLEKGFKFAGPIPDDAGLKRIINQYKKARETGKDVSKAPERVIARKQKREERKTKREERKQKRQQGRQARRKAREASQAF